MSGSFSISKALYTDLWVLAPRSGHDKTFELTQSPAETVTFLIYRFDKNVLEHQRRAKQSVNHFSFEKLQ